VGTAIQYFEGKGYRCEWRHISSDPKEEKLYVQQERPILQNLASADIKPEFRARKSEVGYWKKNKTRAGVGEAEKVIGSALDALGL
jgi:hypothetical protein